MMQSLFCADSFVSAVVVWFWWFGFDGWIWKSICGSVQTALLQWWFGDAWMGLILISHYYYRDAVYMLHVCEPLLQWWFGFGDGSYSDLTIIMWVSADCYICYGYMRVSADSCMWIPLAWIGSSTTIEMQSIQTWTPPVVVVWWLHYYRDADYSYMWSQFSVHDM